MAKKLQRILCIILCVVMLTSCGRVTFHSNGYGDLKESTSDNNLLNDDTDNEYENETTRRGGGDDGDETTGRGYRDEEETTWSQAQAKEAKKEQEKFKKLTDDLFDEEVSDDVLLLHTLFSNVQNAGYKNYEIDLGSFSIEDRKEQLKEYDKYKEALKKIKYEYLDNTQKLVYDILERDLNELEIDEDIYYYDNCLSSSEGIPISLPTVLGGFEMNSKNDVEDYLRIIESVPDYFKEMMEYEKKRSEKGLFIPDWEVDKTVDQCKKFMSTPEKNCLTLNFNERVDAIKGLTKQEKDDFKNRNLDYMRNKLIPAYQYVIDEATKLKGTGKVDGGLSNYEYGKKYYEKMVRQYVGIDKSVDQIKAMIKNDYRQNVMQVTTIGGLTGIDDDMLAAIGKCNEDVSDPEKTINKIWKLVKDDFPEAPSIDLQVKKVPKSMEEYESPAYYIIERLDSNVNQIYINDGNKMQGLELYSTLAHEGYPGHMLQNTYFNSVNEYKVRRLSSFLGYSEGWGTYAELYSYDFAGLSEDEAKLNLLNQKMIFDFYCLADIGINYESWTRDDLKKSLKEFGFDEGVTDDIYQQLVEMPGKMLAYYVGYLQIMELRDEVEDELGKDFEIKEFHEAFLRLGPAPFDILEKYLFGEFD